MFSKNTQVTAQDYVLSSGNLCPVDLWKLSVSFCDSGGIPANPIVTCDPAQSRGSASSENSYMADVGNKSNPPMAKVHFKKKNR